METLAAAVDGENGDFLDQQPDDGFMSDDGDSLHQQPWQEEEDEEEDDFMSDDDDDYWSDSHFISDDDAAFPVHAPSASASEAAIAALEAAEAPGDDDCCPVCLQDDGGGDEAPEPAARPWSRVAPCGHRFHAACVGKWLRVKLSCPVCRCRAAPSAAACRRDDAAAPPEPPRPMIPGMVEEFLAMGYEESRVFEKSQRWMEFMAHPYRHVTWSSSSQVSDAIAGFAGQPRAPGFGILLA